MQRGKRRAAGRHQRQRSSPWFTRVRALLAGALVLGVGATLTLAAWTDTEYATGTFKTSTFGIVGTATNVASPGDFADHATEPGANLTLGLAAAGAMSPGTTVYLRFAVKTTAMTNVAGKVSLSAAANAAAGLGPSLQYGVRIIPASSVCDATSYGGSSTVIVPANSPLSTAGSNLQVLATAGGAPVTYCFAVTLPAGTPNTAQGATVSPTWTFTGVSDT